MLATSGDVSYECAVKESGSAALGGGCERAESTESFFLTGSVKRLGETLKLP